MYDAYWIMYMVASESIILCFIQKILKHFVVGIFNNYICFHKCNFFSELLFNDECGNVIHTIILPPPFFPPTKMEWGCGLLVLITTFTPILFYLYRSYHTSLNKFDPGHICIRDPSYDQNFHRHICRDVIVSCINIGGIF